MIFWSIDFDDYEYLEDTYVLEGWGFSKKSKPVEIQVTDKNGTVIPFNIIRKARPDVQNSFPDRPQVLHCGFTIYIPDVSRIFSQYEELWITFVDEDGNKKNVERKIQDMQEVCFKKTVTYQIDVQDIHGKNLVLQGWIVNRCGKEKIFLQDEKGIELPQNLQRIVREDVNHKIWIDQDKYKAGFNIQVILDNINTPDAYLVIKNNVGEKRIRIPVKEMRFQISKKGRVWNTLKPETWNEHLGVIRKKGFRVFAEQIKKEINPQYSDYDAWVRSHALTKKELQFQKEKEKEFRLRPKISVVIPLYNTPIPYLKKLMQSMENQTYSNWQLCLADGSSDNTPGKYLLKKYNKDERVVYKRLEKNLGISSNTNEAVKMADGDYILLADHDDVIVPQALFEIVKIINERPDMDIIYTDEDKISMDGKYYFEPNFKSDFNIDLLRSVNYICHIFVVKKEIMESAGLFRSEYDGAQDYDFILRCCEKTNKIYHIPQVLYHWRAHPESTAEDPESKRYAYDAGRHAIQEHYRRMGIAASVEDTKYYGIYRTRYKLLEHAKISIIILNKDHIDDLEKCIHSIIEKSTYDNYEIIIAENNSEEKETFRFYEQLMTWDSRIKVITWNGEFNFSAINNFAVNYASGEYFILLNNDIEVISPDWMEEMLGYCQREDVGIVGAKLYYPDDTIQHAGVVIGMGGIAGHILCRSNGNEPGYNGKLVTVQDMSAVTAACLMVKRSIYEMVGGMDETFKVAFNDIDFCMKVRALGKLVVFSPYVEMYHYESKSRGLEDTPEKQIRFAGEIKRFQDKWAQELEKGDPYYNVNLSLKEGDCSLR
ncbi:MAG: glycosyltransferase family 2 protein [Oliverpabstia sp.]